MLQLRWFHKFIMARSGRIYLLTVSFILLFVPHSGGSTVLSPNYKHVFKAKNRTDLASSETMTRYPSIKSPGGVLRGLDYIGTIAFASGGAIAGGCNGMNLLGCVILGIVAAIGGGTTRDVLLGQTPVFWMQEVEYLAMCVVTSVLTFYSWPSISQSSFFSVTPFTDDGPLPRWLDTIGLGAFAIVGTQHGIRRGLHPFITVAVCMITCSFGGIFRDVFLQKSIRVFHSHAEAYLSNAALGSCAYLLSRLYVEDPLIRMSIGFFTTVIARFLSWTYDIRLPLMPKSLLFK